MNIKSAWLYPVVMILLLLALMWALPAGAQTLGTVETDRAFVSSDVVDVGTAGRTLEITVTDTDLDLPVRVGADPADETDIQDDELSQVDIDEDGDLDAADEVIFEIDEALFQGDTFRIRVDGVAPDKAYTVVRIPADEADVLPIVDPLKEGDPVAADVRVGTVDIGAVELRVNSLDNAVEGRFTLEALDDIAANSQFSLRWYTSEAETATATVKGDETSFVISLLEDDPGEYKGTFVAAETASIDLAGILGEQHAIPGGAATLSSSQTFTLAADLADGEDLVITLDNAPIRDADGDLILAADFVAADFTITSDDGDLDFVDVVDPDAGTMTVVADGTLDTGDTFTVAYVGSRQVEITLERLPLQDVLVIGDLVVPADQTVGLLQINDQPAVGGDPAADNVLRLGIREDVPAEGTVVAISYEGSERVEVEANTAEGDLFTVTVLNAPIRDADGDDVVDKADVAIVGHVVTVVDAAAGEITATAGAALSADAGDTVDVQYALDTFANPQNALAPAAAPRPIIVVSEGSRFFVSYLDVSEDTEVETFVDVEATDPAFGDPSPADDSATSDLESVLSIEITDDGSGIDLSTVVFTLSLDGEAGVVIDADNDVSISLVDAAGADASDGDEAVTASIDLAEVELDLDIGIGDADEQVLTWDVMVVDIAGNDAVSDTFILNLDTDEPAMTGAFTGDNANTDPDDDVDTDDGIIEGDRRVGVGVFLEGSSDNTSIRVEFNDALDADSIDASDFTVEDNTVEDALYFADHADLENSVFLVLGTALGPGDTPDVTLADDAVTDAAGNAAPGDTVTAEDGIAPTATVAITPSPSGTGDVTIVVTTDEAIRNPGPGPAITISALDPAAPAETEGAADVDVDAGDATKTAGENKWTYTVEDMVSNTYSVYVVTEDQPAPQRRNRGSVGDDPDDGLDITTGITFEVDVDFAVASLTDPVDGDVEVPLSEPLLIELQFADEEGEYPGDSMDSVTLTKAELDGVDVLETKEVQNDGRTVTLAIEGAEEGEQTLVYSAEDALGNVLEDAELTFTVVERPPWTLELPRGLSLISLPALAASSDINDVFGGNEDIDLVFTFEGLQAKVAQRVDTSAPFDIDPSQPFSLTDIDSSHAYFVNATRLTEVDIDIPPLGASVPPLLTIEGGQWVLVPVISQEDLEDIDQGTIVDAAGYLGAFRAAFRFQRTGLQPLETESDEVVDADLDDDVVADQIPIVRIGSGYWVLYEPGETVLLTPVILP